MLLEDQLGHLDSALLATITTEFPDPLSEAESAQTRAYLVLAHAVLEEYLEDVFQRHFDRLSAWLDDKNVPFECLNMVMAVMSYVPEGQLPSYRKRDIVTVIRGIGRKCVIQRVAANHGLKAGNVAKLAELTGTNWTGLERALNTELADLDTLGSKRGAAGHLSPYTSKSTVIASTDGPDDVRRWIRSGVEAVLAIEKHLANILRAQQASLVVDWDGN